MINWTPKLKFARDFGRMMHNSIGQKRKFSGEPYFVHPEEVAEIISEITNNENVIIGAFLHDFEDIPVADPQSFYTLNLIENIFGLEVKNYVIDLYDVYTKENYPNLNRKQRKQLEAERLGTISEWSQNIKISDLISNTKDLVQQDKNFARIYIKEKEVILNYLTKANPILLERAWKQVKEAKEKLNIE